MFLKYLELQGFKSFPDKTRLNFGRGMTAVVGPNGSGKSNISDAVRWVLGEQSTKALRGAKMEDVIFNGTALRHAHGFAEVRLCLDNADRSLPVDNDEVIIARKYYRNGESEYRICEKVCRLKDVNELFMDTGLGRDGYSLIGQGKISEIVGARPNQRREIFEEASGISKFRYRKEEAERSLTKADDNLLRLRDILGELEIRVGPLLEQSEKAKKFIELSDEKKTLEISLWMRRLHYLKSQLAEQNGAISVKQAEYDALDNDYNKAEERMSAIEDKIRETEISVEKHRNEANANKDSIADMQKQQAVCENNIEHNCKSIDAFGKEIAELSASGSESDNDIAERQRDLSAKGGELSVLGEKRGILSAAQSDILLRKGDFAAKAAKNAEALRVANGEISHIEVVLATAKGDISQYNERIEQLSGSAEEKAKAALEYKKELAETNAFLEELDDRAESLNNSKNGIGMKQKIFAEKLAALNERRNKIAKEANAFAQRAEVLQNMERSMEGFGQSVKFVLDRGAAGNLRGILEPVSKILSVESKYSLAIETAAAAALQNIVVTDEDAAKRAIKMLKEQGRGRVTFLPLTSVRGSRLEERGLSACEGFVGVGCDLVKYDAKYEGVVRSILGRIAVAEDLDCAVAIAKKFGYKFRIVTLDGQLVNAGGSLTGGSSVKSAGLLSRRQEIDELYSKADAKNKEFSATEDEYNRLNADISALNADILATESELRTVSEDRIRAEGEKKRLSMQLSDAESAGSTAEAQRQKLQNDISGAEKRIEEFTALLEKSSKAKGELVSESEKIAKAQAAAAEEEADISKQLSALDVEETRIRGEINHLEEKIGELLQNRETREEKIASLSGQKAEAEKQNTELREKIKSFEAKCAEIEKQNKEIENKVTVLFARRQELEQRTSSEREAQKGIVQRRQEASNELEKARGRLSGMQKEYDDIISQLWDDYDITFSTAESLAIEITEPQKAQRRLNELRGKIKSLGSVNLSAIEEYKEVSERYEFYKVQITDAEKSRDELRALIKSLMNQMRSIFLDRFTQIAGNFAVVFRELFGGGEGKLTLTDPDDVLESGIEITVQPPGKIINNLASLSGGEQTFVAIAIYFAILKVRPAPFCILDEIEAALDEANVDRYADYLLRLTENTQFIAITHRRGTMEHADRLYGVTMQEDGVSKLLELALSDVDKIEK